MMNCSVTLVQNIEVCISISGDTSVPTPSYPTQRIPFAARSVICINIISTAYLPEPYNSPQILLPSQILARVLFYIHVL
jgi:hypothetical protein